MITSLNVQYFQKSDLLEIKQQFSHHPTERTLIQVFSGQIEKTEIAQILCDLTDLFQDTPIIGTTTAGEILDQNVQEHTVVINFCFFDSTTVQTARVDHYDDLQVAGKILADNLAHTQPKALILLGCGLKDRRTVDATSLLSELYQAFPQAIIAGAQAGDNSHGIISYVFTESGITEHGAAVAALSGEDLLVHRNYNLSWIPIGKKRTITKAVGSRVYSIDHQSPLDLYNHYLGSEVAAGLPLAAADFPLMIEQDGILMAVHAMGVNPDGSFDYIHSFHAGEQVQFGFCHAGLLAMAAKQTFDQLRVQPIQVAFIYSCVSRKWILGEDIHVEIAPIAKLATTAGFFAYGEYFTHPIGKCLFFSQTMTVLTLAELSTAENYAPDAPLASLMTEAESKQLKTLRVLHRLVETTTKEIEMINHQLTEMAHQDSLTGLFNRRYFDQQFTAEWLDAEKSGQPFSLILVDVDEFKLYNDTYGHVKGDSCLRALAVVLKEVPQQSADFVARYGGEEFICILPNTNFEQAMRLAEQIQQQVNNLSIPHLASTTSTHVTVSIGVQTVETITQAKTPELILTICDEQLYAAKANGRNRICGNKTA